MSPERTRAQPPPPAAGDRRLVISARTNSYIGTNEPSPAPAPNRQTNPGHSAPPGRDRQTNPAPTQATHAFAVRPRCARAPGSSRHLVHRPHDSTKILTDPSTPPLTPPPRHGVMLGPWSCESAPPDRCPRARMSPERTRATRLPSIESARTNSQDRHERTRPAARAGACRTNPTHPATRKTHDRFPARARTDPIAAMAVSLPNEPKPAHPKGTTRRTQARLCPAPHHRRPRRPAAASPEHARTRAPPTRHPNDHTNPSRHPHLAALAPLGLLGWARHLVHHPRP